MVSMLIVTIALVAGGPQQGPADPMTAKTAQAAPDAVGRAEYLAQRAKTADTADAHWKLGLWCERKGSRPRPDRV